MNSIATALNKGICKISLYFFIKINYNNIVLNISTKGGSIGMKKFTEISAHFLSFFGITFSVQDLTNILNIILLVISIVNIFIVLILNIVNWYKKAHEDGVITKEEQDELRTLIQDASEDVNDEIGKLPHNDKN